jgi:catechol 2,3-dioxygenase-like lactoylglutathione lyase family enzyme
VGRHLTVEFEGLQHVQLAIPEGGEDAARRFWVEIVGLTEIQKPRVLAARGGCWFRGGAVEIHAGVEDDFSPAYRAHPAILVQGLEALAARFERAGVSVQPDAELPGYTRFYAADPFGNRVEFLERKPS